MFFIFILGDDTLYINHGDNLEKNYFGEKFVFPNKKSAGHPTRTDVKHFDDCLEIEKSVDISSILAESKHWTVLQLPQTYMSTNWPIRYSAIDNNGIHLAVAGRTGLAHYSMITKRWKLFGNESQEKDFVVSGGLIWWKDFIVCGCYSLLDRTDEIRCYPAECKLDNEYGNRIQVRAPVISLNMFRNQMIALTADGFVTLFAMRKCDAFRLKANYIYEIDVKSICIHPACIVSLTVTNLRNDLTTKTSVHPENSDSAETIIVNVCGRILMIQRNSCSEVGNSLMASCLASCVEVFWLSNTTAPDCPMRDCLWFYSGIHGMRVWLPILPPSTEQRKDLSHRMHTFMSKRIMLSFPLKLYPLVILFDNVIVLGVENETVIYTNESGSHFALPFSQLERKSQVYLHKILRQLIKRNLGYSAWEIARSCRRLPYFPHSLELLLHEVLEEEATSKDPIPDALLPSILDFIREFPVYLQTIVQCARKTEIALWPYLFSMAGKPKDLFQQCLESEELVTAASYLIILQNLEPSVISKQYATLLLEVALQHKNWELAKDLIRFLKAIDPNEIDSPRSSMVVNVKIAPPNQSQSQVNQNPEAFNLVLGPIGRERSFSTTVIASSAAKEKKDKLSIAAAVTPLGNDTLQSSNSLPIVLLRRKSERNNSTKSERRETFCIEVILQKHARKLLQNCKLIELGYMSAYLDFHLVAWLSQEAEKFALLDDYVSSLCQIHKELNLNSPLSPQFHSELDSEQNCHQLHSKIIFEQQLNLPLISSQTSESGYYSLPLLDTPTSTNYANITLCSNIPSIHENEELKYSSSQIETSINNIPIQVNERGAVCFKSVNYLQPSLGRTTCNPIYSSNDEISASSLGLGLNCSVIYPKILPDKISIKIRYLLQLFIEANCIDMALVLSILLQDASSIGRIINTITRSESLATCIRVQNLLKRFAIWSFDVVCVYRSFIISLQPYIYLLDQFVQSSSTTFPPISVSKLNAHGNVHNSRNEINNTIEFTESSANKEDSSQASNFDHEHDINRKWSHEKYTIEEMLINSSRQLNPESALNSSSRSSHHHSTFKQTLPFGESTNHNESSGCAIM